MDSFTFLRAGDIEATSSTWAAQCAAFVGSARDATLLVVRGDSQIQTFLLGDGDLSRSASLLAVAVGGEAQPVDFDVSVLECGAVGELVLKRSQDAAKVSKVDLDPSYAAQTLSRFLPPHSWVAVKMRSPKSFERRRHIRWVQERMGTDSTSHQSIHPASQVVAVRVGGESKAQVRAILDQMPSIFGGFDYLTKPSLPSGMLPFVLGLFGAGVALVVGTVLGWDLPLRVALAVGVLVVGAVFGFFGMRGSGVSGSRAFGFAMGKVGTRWLSGSKAQVDEFGHVQKPGSYPLKSNAFLLAPDQFVSIVAPQAGATSGAASVRGRALPEVFTTDIGPMIGYSVPGQVPVHLSAADAYEGLVAFGRPGSGKSVLLRTLFAWSVLEQVRPQGKPGFPGENNTIVVFENKGHAEVGKYVSWGEQLGKDVVVFDLLHAASWAVEMVPKEQGGYRNSLTRRAGGFVEAMAYAFPEGSIQFRSKETLTSIIGGALVVADHPKLAGEANLPTDKSFVYYASVLCGAEGDEAGVNLARVIISTPTLLGGPKDDIDPDSYNDICEAGTLLQNLYGESTTKSVRKGLQEAPRSKLAVLAGVDPWFGRNRRRVSWEEVLISHIPVVFNLGVSAFGVKPSEEATKILASMLFFQMKQAIEQTCEGWQEQGRYVSPFCDELSLLAGSNPDIFRWMHDQGRSYGVRQFLASQYQEQLPRELSSNTLGFGTLVAFAQSNSKSAEELVQNLSAGGDDWSVADIVNLPNYQAVVRTSVGGRKQSPFTVLCGFWEADMSNFAQAQGYETAKPASPVTVFGESV